MDMETLLDELYILVVEDDPERIKAFRQAVKTAEPYYKRLRAVLGDEEGEAVWNAAMDIGAAEEGPIFRAGLRLGMKLMTLCLT